MIIPELKWDDENIEHIARHGVNIVEFEDICFEPHLCFLGHSRRHISLWEDERRQISQGSIGKVIQCHIQANNSLGYDSEGKTQLQDAYEKEGTMSEKLKSYPNPKFTSLEEERKYWEVHGPLAEGYKGKIQRSGQKRSSFLAVRLTGEELTRLRDVAAKQGLGPSTFARVVLTSAIDHEARLPRRITLNELKNILESSLPQIVKDKAEALTKASAIGDPDNPTLILIDGSHMREFEEFGLLWIRALLAIAGVRLITPQDKEYEKVRGVAKTQT